MENTSNTPAGKRPKAKVFPMLLVSNQNPAGIAAGGVLVFAKMGGAP
jgi:hypothetical protein